MTYQAFLQNGGHCDSNFTENDLISLREKKKEEGREEGGHPKFEAKERVRELERCS